MKQELMNAILAMDSYNRGYDPNISLVQDPLSPSIKVGNWDLSIQSDDGSDPNSAGVQIGFYAAAYTYNNDTIISYRGTNDQFSVNDVLSDWDFSGLNDIYKAPLVALV